jgi:VIT1/CCC1 family predicted Fe2+/Mn2+ transporter
VNKGRAFDAREIAVFQRNEITDHQIYKNLSGKVSGIKNRRILFQIADDEMRHYNVWKNYTRKDVGPDRFKVWFYMLVSTLFGSAFGLKLMENGEKKTHALYNRFPGSIKEVNGIVRDEEEHEQALLMLLGEDRLKETGSLVPGLNNALVELMGVLAGFTFVLHNTTAVALAASIAAIAVALSMAAAGYLSTKNEQGGRNPFFASLYTGFASLFTVLALIAPYLFLEDRTLCLGLSFFISVSITGIFNYYLSVVRNLPFKSRFLEMAGLIFTVTALSFLAGYAINYAFHYLMM